MCVRKAGACLKAGTCVYYVRLQPTCAVIQLLCSSSLISQFLCGCNKRLSKSLCESSSPREMNLFVQKRTSLNQLIHFSDIVGRNKYTFYNLPLSCFLARLQEEQLNFIERDTFKLYSFVRKGETRAVQTQWMADSLGHVSVNICSPVPLSGLNTKSHTVLMQTFLLHFLPWQLFSSQDLGIYQLVGIRNNSRILPNALC